MRKYRRCGLGAHAARQIIRSHPGVWEIPILSCNLPAQAFWPNAVAGLAGYDVEELSGDGERWSGPILRLVPKQDSHPKQTS